MSCPRSIEFSSKNNKKKVNICLLWLWMDVLVSWESYAKVPQCSLNKSFRDRSPTSSIGKAGFFWVPFPWIVDNFLLLYHPEAFPLCVSVSKCMLIRTLVTPDWAHPYHPKLSAFTFWSPRQLQHQYMHLEGTQISLNRSPCTNGLRETKRGHGLPKWRLYERAVWKPAIL